MSRRVDETLLRRRRAAAVSALRELGAHDAAAAIQNGDLLTAFASPEQIERIRDQASAGRDEAVIALDALGLLWAVLP